MNSIEGKVCFNRWFVFVTLIDLIFWAAVIYFLFF